MKNDSRLSEHLTHYKSFISKQCHELTISFLTKKKLISCKGAVHILGKICPRSNPDITHKEYSMEPLNVIYKLLLLYDHQGARFGEILARFGHSNPMGSHILVPLPMFRPNIILFTYIRPVL